MSTTETASAVATLMALVATTSAAANTILFSIMISDTGNGDGIVQPGEHAILDVWARLDPGVGAIVKYPSPGGGIPATVLGFCQAEIDVIPIVGGATGHFANWYVPSPLAVGPFQGTAIGNGIYDIYASNESSLLSDNPIRLWHAEWMPHSYAEHSVAFVTQLSSSLGPMALVQWDGGNPGGMEWGQLDIPVVFQVVPAPGVLALGIVASGFAIRRARR